MNKSRRLVFSERNSAILDWLEKLKKHLEEKCRKDYKTTANHFNIEWDVGQKWIRVWQSYKHTKSIYLYMCPEGKIYKPEGLKRPHRTPRGSIDATDPTTCDDSGAWLYLRK